jgi:hypothetical protein
MNIGSQFSTGDQSCASKEVFWRSGFKKCPNKSCTNENNEETILESNHVAGVRNNGDAYGTCVFTCKSCGWNTSFLYDEASDVYYYETRNYEVIRDSRPSHPWNSMNFHEWFEGILTPSSRKKLMNYSITGEDLYNMTDRRLKALGFDTLDRHIILREVSKRKAINDIST